MRALAVDIGTGTQDVLFFDDGVEVENCVRLVLPSPTVIVAQHIRAATRGGRSVVLTGRIMGGGPSHWAARDHAAAGLRIWAGVDAARTFDDDPDAVEAMGIRVVPDDQAEALAQRGDVLRIEAGDLALGRICDAVAGFGVDLRAVDAVAVAVFDHGAAPVGESDRRFRFARLEERLRERPFDGPAAFAWPAASVPSVFTRLTAAVAVARAWLGDDRPVLGMDTAPAAVLGALDDGAVRAALEDGRTVVAVNVGNFHTLAARVQPGGRLDGVFEHHTGELDRAALQRFLAQLADGTLDGEEVFRSQGHGGLLVEPGPAERPLLAVTGPRRALLGADAVPGLGVPHLAVPHADMMQTGSFGLLRALARHVPAWREPIERRLGPAIPGGVA